MRLKIVKMKGEKNKSFRLYFKKLCINENKDFNDY